MTVAIASTGELLLQRVRSVHRGIRSTSGPETTSRVGSNFITWCAISSGASESVGNQWVHYWC